MQAAIYAFAGPVLTADEAAFFRDCEPAGFILFRRNCVDPGQLLRLTDSLRDLSGRGDVPILMDQEGGRVARMRPPEWPAFPPGDAFARLYRVAPSSAIEAARSNARAIGLTLRSAGINVDALPLLDVRQPDADDIVGFTDFITFLAPPPQKPLTAQGRLGQAVFHQIGCADCHQPTMRTGRNPVRALDRVVFHPYSDFLLHDMGERGDGSEQGWATGREMGTAPLWGLRELPFYLHDGRAETVDEAIASTTEGLDHFMSRGITPRFTTWCPEPTTPLGRDNPDGAPLEYHIRLLEAYRETLEKHGLKPPPGYGVAGAGNAVFSVSSFMDTLAPEEVPVEEAVPA